MNIAVRMCILLLAACLGVVAWAADVPLGHPDFYPSPERPIGWRGDGTGAFPGATPVTSWNSKTGDNVVWKARMPAPSWSQPLVVGEKVFVTADPNWLICVNIHTGAILWKQQVDHLTQLPEDKAKEARAELAFFDKLFPVYVDACRDMAKMQSLAKAKGLNPDELKRAVLTLGAVDSIYPAVKEYKSAEYDKALTDAELKPLLESLLALRKAYAFTFTDPRRGDNWSAIEADYRNTTAGRPLIERMKALVTTYDIWPWPLQNWYGCTTMTFATPCSDGKNIYVAFPNNQTACYDLDGNQKWLVWDHPAQKQDGLLHTRFCASPFLVGDALVVNQNAELRVYDAATGTKRWGIWDPYMQSRDKRDKTKGSRPYRPFPEGSSPVLVRLPLEGKTLDLIADGGGNVYRVSDGKVVGAGLPACLKGQTPVAAGDLYLWKSGADSGVYPVGVCRLTAESADKVTWTELWRVRTNGKGECTPMLYGGVVYDGNQAWEAETGKELPTTRMGFSWNSPILAGNYIVGAGGRNVGPFKEAGKATANVLVDDIDIADPEWSRTVYCGQTGTFGNSSFYASGNRVFFRTAGYLWCIGDPKAPFVGPKDCPADARAAKE
jgi:outer membrane protein assembly factor BamB